MSHIFQALDVVEKMACSPPLSLKNARSQWLKVKCQWQRFIVVDFSAYRQRRAIDATGV